MLNIDIMDDTFHIKSINNDSMKGIYSIYANAGDFKYATGVFNSIEYEPFFYQISQFIQRSNVFFLDVCFIPTEEIMGLIKGSILEKDKIAWINSIVINKRYQSKGYGKRVLGLLENHLKNDYDVKNIYISVSQSNMSGLKFWKNCGYRKCDHLAKKNSNRIYEYVHFMCKML